MVLEELTADEIINLHVDNSQPNLPTPQLAKVRFLIKNTSDKRDSLLEISSEVTKRNGLVPTRNVNDVSDETQYNDGEILVTVDGIDFLTDNSILEKTRALDVPKFIVFVGKTVAFPEPGEPDPFPLEDWEDMGTKDIQRGDNLVQVQTVKRIKRFLA